MTAMMRLFRPLPPAASICLCFCLCLGLAACAAAPRAAPAPPRPLAAAPAPQPAQRYHSGDTAFDGFLEQMRAAALAEGITAQTFDRVAGGLKPDPRILDRNANQPEFSRPVWAYLDSAVSARRIRDAKAMLTAHAAMLEKIETRYGVPKEILVAIWGMESDYGAAKGGYNLFSALATLAFQGPRTAYARPEFLAALQIYQRQQYDLRQMTSSWAGAFGQTQFTPTTFLKYASDGDGDGHIDLWNSPADALASAARLLADRGWQKGQNWGYEVRLPKGFAYETADTDTTKPVAAWRKLGVTTAAGHRLPAAAQDASIYLPAGARGPAFLLFPNFRVILKYNNAASYGLAVGLLADRMAGGDGVRHSWPRDEQPLSRDERILFQQRLAVLGFDPGPADGIVGRATRAALRRFQKAHGLAADGFVTKAMLERLNRATGS